MANSASRCTKIFFYEPMSESVEYAILKKIANYHHEFCFFRWLFLWMAQTKICQQFILFTSVSLLGTFQQKSGPKKKIYEMGNQFHASFRFTDCGSSPHALIKLSTIAKHSSALIGCKLKQPARLDRRVRAEE